MISLLSAAVTQFSDSSSIDQEKMMDLYYKLERKRMGSAVIINNLDEEQSPTRRDVESMTSVFQLLGEN